MFIKNTEKSLSQKAGFTLVELAVVMIIIGLILGSMSTGLRIWNQSYTRSLAKNNLENAMAAMVQFYGVTGRYPCPADPSLTIDDANYGAEDCTLATVPGENDTNDPVYIGALPIYGFDDSAGDPAADRIYVRSLLPSVSELGKSIADPWNVNFVYAVTQALTVTDDNDPLTLGDFDNARGSIKVRDEFNEDTAGTDSNAHFIILSRGEDSDCVNGAGGPLPPTIPPTPAPAFQSPERENCDNDAEFSYALQSRGTGDYYDDYLQVRRAVTVGIWAPVAATTGAATSDLFPMPSGKVFLGSGSVENYEAVSPAGLNLKLDVDGDIIVDDRIGASLICDDSNMTNCFQPESLYDLECSDAGEYMKGISINGSNDLVADCQPLVFEPVQDDCSTGQFLNGIYSDGSQIICQSR